MSTAATMLTDATPAPAPAPAADPAPAPVDPATTTADPAPADPAPADPATTTADPKPVEQTPEQIEEARLAAIDAHEFTFEEGIVVDPDTLSGLKETAKELGLTPEQAQKIADLGAKQSQRWEAAQTAAIQEAEAAWIADLKADKEIGGANLAANLAIGKTALETFGSPELTQLLNESRLGNHPEVNRFFYKVGKAMADDNFVSGARTASERKDPAKSLYDNSNMN